MQVLWRYVLAWMGAAAIMNVYFSRWEAGCRIQGAMVTRPVCRINLSTAIVAMVGVERRPGHSGNISAGEPVCPERGAAAALNTTDTAAAAEGEEQYFDWDKRQQGLLLGSYYWSYTAAQVCHQTCVRVQTVRCTDV